MRHLYLTVILLLLHSTVIAAHSKTTNTPLTNRMINKPTYTTPTYKHFDTKQLQTPFTFTHNISRTNGGSARLEIVVQLVQTNRNAHLIIRDISSGEEANGPYGNISGGRLHLFIQCPKPYGFYEVIYQQEDSLTASLGTLEVKRGQYTFTPGSKPNHEVVSDDNLHYIYNEDSSELLNVHIPVSIQVKNDFKDQNWILSLKAGNCVGFPGDPDTLYSTPTIKGDEPSPENLTGERNSHPDNQHEHFDQQILVNQENLKLEPFEPPGSPDIDIANTHTPEKINPNNKMLSFYSTSEPPIIYLEWELSLDPHLFEDKHISICLHTDPRDFNPISVGTLAINSIKSQNNFLELSQTREKADVKQKTSYLNFVSHIVKDYIENDSKTSLDDRRHFIMRSISQYVFFPLVIISSLLTGIITFSFKHKKCPGPCCADHFDNDGTHTYTQPIGILDYTYNIYKNAPSSDIHSITQYLGPTYSVKNLISHSN